MPWYTVTLILLGVILFVLTANKEASVSKLSAYTFGGLIAGLLIGIFLFGYYTLRSYAGMPIGEFRDGNAYEVVSFSTITNANSVILGLRKTDDSRFMKGSALDTDYTLRIYRIPDDMPIVNDIKEKRLKLPAKIRVHMVNGIPSFTY